jgi:hypothetical protein
MYPTWALVAAEPSDVGARAGWQRNDVVSRRINFRPDVVERSLLGSDRRITMRIDGGSRIALRPFELDLLGPSLRARGRLHLPGVGLVRFARIEVDISALSDTACELRVVPVCRHLYRWGGRRYRRYFAAAQAAADRIGDELVVRHVPKAPQRSRLRVGTMLRRTTPARP